MFKEAPGPLRRVIAVPFTDSFHGLILIASECDFNSYRSGWTLPQYLHVGYMGLVGVPVLGLCDEALLGLRGIPCLGVFL